MAPEAVPSHPPDFGTVFTGAHHNKNSERDAIENIWGDRTPHNGPDSWPIRVDSYLKQEPEKWVQSACVMCSNGCGMDIGVKNGEIVGVRGRAIDRVNKGRLGPKGLYSWETQRHKDRLTYPLVRKNGKLERASWDEAMDLIVAKTKETSKRLTNHGIGFYTTGQFFLEEYYTLAVIGKAGLSTLHMDGNTRLCTATAAASMRESFGSDGQPGSYTDIDVTNCIMLVGHNMSSTQTVLWSRILDRLAGPDPPQIIVIDPRASRTAKEATIHLAPKVGTNVAVLNGLQKLIFDNGWEDKEFIKKHTIGIEDLRQKVEKYNPELVEKISGIPAGMLRAAAKILGESKTLLSTALQGVYQSNQATAAACQINNINLIMGKIGKPGSGVYQMNGQPTAQNNRETGCNGEFPGFRNHQNKNHMADLADHWNIEMNRLPHWQEPTHIMQMLSYIANDSMEMFWISGTNPLVSLPDLNRVRKLLTKPNLFVVVQDIFMTETCDIADVVLPAAQWAEKTGCFTNVDRTVHISHQAVDPPGECKSDLDIFVDYARRMDFKDKAGNPLVYWKTPEEAFEAWKKSTKGRPCDYTGISYAKLTGGSGIQWPCNEEYPSGKERLYADGIFPTDVEHCESYGHDLETGTTITKEDYYLMNPAGRAILKCCNYIPPREIVNDEYPFALMTGRNVYQFHTRTKTGRTKRLAEAAPDAQVQLNEDDAKRLEIKQGDMVLVTGRRGKVQMPANVGDIAPGKVFVPMHWGYWDKKDDRSRAGNELTDDQWDLISKQPAFKSGAVRVEKVEKAESGEVTIHAKEGHTPAVKAMEERKTSAIEIQDTRRRRRHLEFWLVGIEQGFTDLLSTFKNLKERHQSQKEFGAGVDVMVKVIDILRSELQPVFERFPPDEQDIPKRSSLIMNALFPKDTPQPAPYEFIVDCHSLFTMVAHLSGCFVSLTPAAGALWDDEFQELSVKATTELGRVQAWVKMQMMVHGAQTLVVPSVINKGEEAEW